MIRRFSKSKKKTHKKKTHKKPLVIIIGGGVGGLSAAALLTLKNYKVIVLEKSSSGPAGCLSVFTSELSDWPVGIQFVGGNVGDPVSKFGKLMNKLTEGRQKWLPNVPIDTIFVDKIFGFIPYHTKLQFHNRFNEEIQSLKDEYPSYASNIAKFDEHMKELSSLLEDRINNPDSILPTETWADVLDKCGITNSILRKKISAIVSLGQLSIDKASAIGFSWMINYYRNGSYYPIGGPQEISHNIEQTVKRHGGKVVYNALVEEVLINSGKVSGVRYTDSTTGQSKIIKASKVISTIGAYNTYCKLFKDSPLFQDAKNEINSGKLPLSSSVYTVYLTLKNRKDGYPKEYIFNVDNPTEPILVMFGSERDPDYKNRHPNTSSAQISIVGIPFDLSNDNEEKDEIYKKRCLDYFEYHYPDYVDDIVETFTQNPHELGQMLGSSLGADYGVALIPERVNNIWLKPKTSLNGFYMGGMDVFSPNLYGAILGSMSAVNFF